MVRRQPVLGEQWQLVERQHLLEVIERDAGRGGGIVLCGPPGVGKTRLAREALARLKNAGRPVQRVAATRATSAIPFGAVSHLLPKDGRDLPEAPHGLVVAVDDAHMLDDASAAVIHQLAVRGGVFLLVTVRDGQQCPDAVTALWTQELATRIELPRLTDHAVAGLLDQTFDAALDQVHRRQLIRVSAGNPLLLRETLRAGLDTAALRFRHGRWRWNGQVRATTRLIEVVAARLGAVRGPVARVVELTACGEPLPALALEQLCGAESVAAAELRGLVVIERSGERAVARLTHPLYGEVIRSSMPWATARARAGELAAAISATPMRRRDDALRVGVWQLHAGRPGDPRILLAATKQALRRFDVTLAARLARAARDSGGGWQAEYKLAQILSDCGWYEQAARALPVKPEDAAALTRWAIVRADTCYWGLGRADEADRTLTEAGSAPDRRAAEAHRSLTAMFDSRCADSVRLGARVLDRADAEPQAALWAAVGASASAGILGDHNSARTYYEHATTVSSSFPDALPWGQVQAGTGYCMALLAMGRVDEAWAISEREYQAAVRAERPEPLGVWAGYHGAVAKAGGDLATATRLLRESLTLLARYDTFRMAAPCLAALAGTYALAGDASRAARLLAHADQPQHRASRLFLPWMELDRAWTHAASGDTTTAAALARHAAALAHDACQPTIEAWALYDAARHGDAPAVHIRLTKLAATLDEPAPTAFAKAAGALAASDADQLEHAAAAFTDLGLHLHAAEAATTAAILHRQASRPSRATRATERATRYARNCPDAQTPLLNHKARSSTLTRREREIVTLAAAGRSSRQIAQQLGLSTRTIDNHLSHAYHKLGVRSRTELST